MLLFRNRLERTRLVEYTDSNSGRAEAVAEPEDRKSEIGGFVVGSQRMCMVTPPLSNPILYPLCFLPPSTKLSGLSNSKECHLQQN